MEKRGRKGGRNNGGKRDNEGQEQTRGARDTVRRGGGDRGGR